MSFSVEYSGLAITHLIYRAALILAVVRWIFSSAIRLITYRGRVGFRSTPNSVDTESRQLQLLHSLISFGLQIPLSPTTTSLSSMVSDEPASDDDDGKFGQMMMIPHSATYQDFAGRPESCTTCAVCLDELKKTDKVRELRNCCHVFHKRCIDRWLNHHGDHPGHHHHHSTCPVCRTPILRSSSSASLTCRSEPSWAVERLLYLFGDDLHPLL